MSFVGNNTENGLKITFTPYGLKTLGRKGLNGPEGIVYYQLWDDDINYQVDATPNLLTDISGNKNIVPTEIIVKNFLIATK